MAFYAGADRGHGIEVRDPVVTDELGSEVESVSTTAPDAAAS